MYLAIERFNCDIRGREIKHRNHKVSGSIPGSGGQL